MLAKAVRDIVHRSSHNQRVSTLTELAMNGSQANGAGRYAQIRGTARVHERALFAVARIPSELELQARWFAGDFGRAFVSTNGNRIDIVQFGVWNREAGPDFRDAAIRIDGGEPMHGCIEIDLLDRSWESHGHAINPAFEATALHAWTRRNAFPGNRNRAGVQGKQVAVHTSHATFAAPITA